MLQKKLATPLEFEMLLFIKLLRIPLIYPLFTILLSNLILVQKKLQGTNTSAYFAPLLLTKKQNLIALTAKQSC
jgi:hypothetical protein